MFGENPIRHQIKVADSLAVEAMFYTIQGEGPYSGAPALFIRLAGCNLACHFCDTQFETQAEKPQLISQILDDLVSRFTPQQRKLVVLTGGEPMRQPLHWLCFSLIETGTEVIQIETAGTLWQPELTPMIDRERVVIVCSPKTPKVHPGIVEYCQHWKYIITAGEQSSIDGLPIRGTQKSNRDVFTPIYRAPPTRVNQIWVSPCDQYNQAKNEDNLKAVLDAALEYGYRISLQTHKILGVE